MSEESLFAEREHYTRARIEDLRQRLGAAAPSLSRHGLVVYAAGSYGRMEAGAHSDIDLFFVYEGEPPSAFARRLLEGRLFRSVREIASSMEFPPFDKNGAFLETRVASDVIRELGSRHDDYRNHFTSRMLMILESEPLVNEGGYQRVLERYLDSYMRDFTGHSDEFHFMMLYNDIARYWKTLTLNYEHRRNTGSATERSKAFTEEDRLNHKAKNFKLKFSRLTTCFSFVGALSASLCEVADPEGSPRDVAYAVSRMTPRERLALIAYRVPDLRELVDDLLSDYEWFMGLTGLTKEELHSKFVKKEDKQYYFSRAAEFGEKVFVLLNELDVRVKVENQRIVRYLAM